MKDIMLFDDFPKELTYPNVTPQLFYKAKEFALNNGIFNNDCKKDIPMYGFPKDRS